MTVANKKHARDMDDAEFAHAMRTQAWRDDPPEPPPPVVTPGLLTLVRQHVAAMSDHDFALAVANSDWRTNLQPMRGPGARTKPALQLSDAEFATAMKARAWRNAIPAQ